MPLHYLIIASKSQRLPSAFEPLQLSHHRCKSALFRFASIRRTTIIRNASPFRFASHRGTTRHSATRSRQFKRRLPLYCFTIRLDCGETTLPSQPETSHPDTVSPGSLRVARRFLIDFLADPSLPDSLLPLCDEVCARFQNIESHLKSIHTDVATSSRPIVDHAIALLAHALKCADTPPAFIRYIHQNAEDLGVTRRDLIDHQLWA